MRICRYCEMEFIHNNGKQIFCSDKCKVASTRNRKYRIYGLINPITNSVFYIGCTLQTLKVRLGGHIFESKANRGNPKMKHTVILELIDAGKEPIIKLVENIGSADTEVAHDREKYWIHEYFRNGITLTNKEYDWYEGKNKDMRERIENEMRRRENELSSKEPVIKNFNKESEPISKPYNPNDNWRFKSKLGIK